MIAGIIGDLAASTWLRDKSVFYHKLFDEEATISEYGLSTIAAAAVLDNAESTGTIATTMALANARAAFSRHIYHCHNAVPTSPMPHVNGPTISHSDTLRRRPECFLCVSLSPAGILTPPMT